MSTVPAKAGAGFGPKYQRVLTPNMVNSVAISDDGKRVVAGYYYYPYPGTTIKDTNGEFCTFCTDETGKRIWADQYIGVQGVFAVAISGDGLVAAAGGILKDSANGPPFQGLLRAYDATNGNVLLDYKGLVGKHPVPGAAGPPDTG